MKFALTRIRFILIPAAGVRTSDMSLSLIQKMYDLEYGTRASKVFGKTLDKLTPNEERLMIALQTRFANFASDENPLTVFCGEHDYVFIRGTPLDGFFIPSSDCYAV